MPAIKSYVINMAKNPERMQSMRVRLEELGIDYERLDAVDGSKVSEEDFESFKRARPRNGKRWNRGQMGCFLSQYALWQKAAASPDAYTAIFEDDMHISDAIIHFLKDDSWIPPECDIVRLETSTNRLLLSKEPVATHHGRGIYKVNSTSWCAGGYILKKQCAQRLISVPESQHNTADHFLFCFEDPAMADKLNLAQVVPALCVQDKFFHLNAENTIFKSEIVTNHEGSTLQARLKYLFKRSPLTFIKKTLQGYKKIGYAA